MNIKKIIRFISKVFVISFIAFSFFFFNTIKIANASSSTIYEGLTHYYSFDDESNLGYDSISANSNASINGGTSTEGYKNGAYNGGEGYIQMPNNAIDGTANAFTFSAWIYPTSTADYQKLMDFGKDQNLFFQIMLRPGESGYLHIQTGLTMDGDQGSTSTHLWGGTGFNAVPLNEWSHIVLTVDDKHAVLYVNGQVIHNGEFKKSLTEFCSVAGAQDANYIGKSHFNDPNFGGKIDEVLIYNRVLSLTDIEALLLGQLPEKQVVEGTGSVESSDVYLGLQYYYAFDGLYAGTDYSGNKSNAIMSSNSIELKENGVNDNLGKYMVFNGKNDFIVLPQNVGPKDKSNFTYTSLIYFDSIAEYTRIFDFGDSQKAYFDLRIRRNGVLETSLTNDSTAGESRVSTKEGAVKVGQWMHIALTVNGSKVNIYVDGVLVGTGNFARDINTLYNNNLTLIKQNYIGLSRYGQDPKFAGAMDEIRVYNRTLSYADILLLSQGEKYAIANAEINETPLINGQNNYPNCITAVSSDVTVIDGNYIINSNLTVKEFINKLTLIDGAKVVIVDNYDFVLEENVTLTTGCYVKIYFNNIVVERIRIYNGDYVKVTIQKENGDEDEELVALKGEVIELPYLVKEKFEHTGFVANNTQYTTTYTVTSEVTLVAQYKEKNYIITIDLRDGTYYQVIAKPGETINVLSLGIDNLYALRDSKGNFIGKELKMPSYSFLAYAIFEYEEYKEEDVEFKIYNGSFSENSDNSFTSTDTYSLGIVDGVHLENGSISATFNATAANDCGIIFWAETNDSSYFWENPPAQYHIALLNYEGWLLISKVNYDGKQWDCVIDCKLENFQSNHDYVMTIVLDGNKVQVYLDNVLYLEYTETSTIVGDNVGFRCINSSVTIKFDAIIVEKKY